MSQRIYIVEDDESVRKMGLVFQVYNGHDWVIQAKSLEYQGFLMSGILYVTSSLALL